MLLVKDKSVVVLPRELSRHDIRLIMYSVLDIFGTTNNEKTIITRNTIQQLGFVQEVRHSCCGSTAWLCPANTWKGFVLHLTLRGKPFLKIRVSNSPFLANRRPN